MIKQNKVWERFTFSHALFATLNSRSYNTQNITESHLLQRQESARLKW